MFIHPPPDFYGVSNTHLLKQWQGGFLYGRSPDSEQMEPAVAQPRRWHSVSVEEIQDKMRCLNGNK